MPPRDASSSGVHAECHPARPPLRPVYLARREPSSVGLRNHAPLPSKRIFGYLRGSVLGALWPQPTTCAARSSVPLTWTSDVQKVPFAPMLTVGPPERDCQRLRPRLRNTRSQASQGLSVQVQELRTCIDISMSPSLCSAQIVTPSVRVLAQADPRRPDEADGGRACAVPVDGVRHGRRGGPRPAHVLRPGPLRHGGQRSPGAAWVWSSVLPAWRILGTENRCERECSHADMVRVRTCACLSVPATV